MKQILLQKKEYMGKKGILKKKGKKNGLKCECMGQWCEINKIKIE